MKTSIIFILLYYSLSTYANDYTVGSGSEYKMVLNKSNTVHLAIYVSQSIFEKLGVEMYMKSNDMLSPEMWQQFIFKMDVGGNFPLKITEAYFQTSTLKIAERIPYEAMIRKQDGITLDNFFFTKQKEIDKDKIKDETIEVAAGQIKTTHYRKKRDGQTIDFWIAESIKPISLVKLVSTSSKKDENNYTIELTTLISGVRPHINPDKSAPLSKEGADILSIKKH